MYLFIFTVLLVIFQYVNSKNIFESNTVKIDNQNERLLTYKDSIEVLNENVFELSSFKLENSEDAITYFEYQGYSIDKLIPFIKDELFNLNQVKAEEHPLIPYAASEGRKMLINSVRLLNHKWIIADFSDGSNFWGEMLIGYELTQEGAQLKFKVIESFLYPTINN